MYAAILALTLVGQCSGGSCPTPISGFQPQLFGSPSVQLAYRVVEQPPAVKLDWAWHKIDEDGWRFSVWGYTGADGKIKWDAGLKENLAQLAKVERAKAAKLTAMAKTEEQAKAVVGDRPISGLNFGLNTQKLAEGGTRYTSNSPEATAFSYGAQAGDSPKDKFYLTVIGDKAERAPVKASFDGSDFAGLRDQVWFGEYDKGEWQVKDQLGYHADNGKPTVLLQSPSGRVLYRAFDYSAGSAPIIQALRKADPNYNPENDPGPGRKPKKEDSLLTPGRLALVGLVLAGLLLAMPRRKQS